ncbi:AmmeMemoRadiSam system protein B [Thalassospira profundimaris]|uniref:AmmeMemoRadiSam system protein B n=1 Tax=Thalassospira profundimaris TaxID=502049 RepID=UPI000DEDE535|nr:AmmeMemoRadiSam system protein B [Thalassospira profundimaris]
MTVIRPAAIAGRFYPADAQTLRSTIASLMAQAGQPGADAASPKAIIVPHAGLVYSGTIAADGFATILPAADSIRRIVIIGPAHRMAFQGIAVADATAFATPLGNVPVDEGAINALLALPQVQRLNAAHVQEHGLEIELPFIQHIFAHQPDVTIVPLLVSRCAAHQVEEVVEKLWGGPETLIVISSDLSHFHDDATARKMDDRTRQLIENFTAEELGFDDACGCLPIVGLLRVARKRAMKVKTLSMQNSSTASGDTSRVVGYGAWAFFDGKADAAPQDSPEDAAETDFAHGTEAIIKQHGRDMLRLASASIQHGLANNAPLAPDMAMLPPALHNDGACFVTLKQQGNLRGCIGSILAHRPLGQDICENAFKAAFADPRFDKISAADLTGDLAMSISVLSAPKPFPFRDEADLIARLTPFEDGIILSDGTRRGLFLPQVWDQLPDPRDFLRHLKRKAGLSMDYWSDSLRAQRFVTRGIESSDIFPGDSLWAQSGLE